MASLIQSGPPAIEHIRQLPFVTDLRYTTGADKRPRGNDGTLELRTAGGVFRLAVEVKRSYLTSSAVDPLLAWLSHARAEGNCGFILLVHHVSRQAAERLVGANISFADDAGNMHLQLGEQYNWTVLGIPAPERASEQRSVTASQLQLLFQFATQPDSVNWTVRRLEEAAGVSKSKVAMERHQLAAAGLLTRTGKRYDLQTNSTLAERLITGYAQVLRPKLALGRFRPAERSIEAFLARLKTGVPAGIRYALTGAPAAELVQHYSRSPEASIFIEAPARSAAQELRLIPDLEGPVTLLRAFGETVFWESREGHMLAPPWLVYAELLCSEDPRAKDAAQEFRREFID